MTQHHDRDGDADHEQQQQLAVADAEDVAEQDVRRRRGEPVVLAEQVDADAEPEREHHADRRVAIALLAAQRRQQRRDDDGADERARHRVVGHQQPGRRAGERQLARAVHGERHAAHHDERADQPAGDRDHRAREERVLGERLLQVEVEVHAVHVVVAGLDLAVGAEDDDPVTHAHDVDRRAVQRAQALAREDLVGRADRPAPAGEVQHAVDVRQDGVDLVGDEHDRGAVLAPAAVEQGGHLVLVRRIE